MFCNDALTLGMDSVSAVISQYPISNPARATSAVRRFVTTFP